MKPVTSAEMVSLRSLQEFLGTTKDPTPLTTN